MPSSVSASVGRRRRNRKRRDAGHGGGRYRFGLRVYPRVHHPSTAARLPDRRLRHSAEGVPAKTLIVSAGVGWRRRK